MWARQLKGTWIGDADLDGEFNSADLVSVFQKGAYDNDAFPNVGWADGDWNADGKFDSGDFVFAFADGGYEAGRRSVRAVPEPDAYCLLICGLLTIHFRRIFCSA